MLRSLVVLSLLFMLVVGPAEAVVYVKWDAPGPARDGKSWNTAFLNINDGMNAANLGEDVWVARGQYNGGGAWQCNRLMGGFAGDPNQPQARDPELYTTIVLNGLSVNAFCTLDGLTIQGATTGVEVGGGNVEIVNCIIQGNTGSTSTDGAGIRAKLGGLLHIQNCTIRGNSLPRPGFSGGGIYANNCSLVIEDSIIEQNQGGIYIQGWTVMRRTKIVGNYGAQIIGTGSAQVEDCQFENNHTDGTGIAMVFGKCILSRCTFSGNSGAGGMLAAGLITDTLFSGNQGYCLAGGATLVNCTFAGNQYIANDTCKVSNCVFAFNSGDVSGASSNTYRNCLAWSNGGTQPSWVGSNGNIAANPLFVNGYHIGSNSPCVDTGYNGAYGVGDIDLDSQPRLLDGNHDGIQTVDMGAYEYAISLVGAKGIADATIVNPGYTVVTAQFPDRFYVENPTRSCGIAVTGSGVAVDDVVSVLGTMSSSDGERMLSPMSILKAPYTERIGPLCMRNAFTGGGPQGAQNGITGASGLNNIGLLARTHGYVTARSLSEYYRILNR